MFDELMCIQRGQMGWYTLHVILPDTLFLRRRGWLVRLDNSNEFNFCNNYVGALPIQVDMNYIPKCEEESELLPPLPPRESSPPLPESEEPPPPPALPPKPTRMSA